ncbi:MAG: hypothetical protein DUW69_002307, partial [Verrucomicrobia bacterium]
MDDFHRATIDMGLWSGQQRKHGPRAAPPSSMTLRESLLALLREANYSPANEFELSRRLGL